LGKGLSSFRGNTVRFFPLPLPEGGIDAHSGYIQSFYENGYVGFACYLALYLAILWRAWNGRKVDPRGAWIVIAVIFAHMLASYSDNIYYYLSVNWYFWSFLGIVFAKWDRVAQSAGERIASRQKLRVPEAVSSHAGTS
jgi:hypothetical protein